MLHVTPKMPEASTYKVLVSFSHHAFTRELKGEDQPAERFGPANDVRCFCMTRLVLSHALPKLIVAASVGKAYFPARGHAKQRNFLLVELSPFEPPYLVVFNLNKAKKAAADVAMFVVSAHPRPNLLPRSKMDTISFATLVSKVAQGLPITRPPKKK
ncbi:hypothetical protein [Brevundimonas sp.]|uniref:hypothetical protein n=1 Tax=Brevundimonas sp. TaxID=1871086 RepID=UPI002C97353A|nr:hypothetical protein [Brevundimonas sp.]HWQ85871.1 hypothetical protein [Brevundimonas sp.]